MDNQWKKAAGEAIAHSGWVLLFSPRVLFLLGTLQALTPYLWWYLEGTNPHYRFQITYIPLLVWVVGYLCFCIGTFFATRARPGRIQDDGLSLRRARIYTSLLLVVALGEVLAVIRAYGTVPIFAYLSGQATVNEVDASNWWQMKYGQLGALQLTLYFLNGLLL